MKKQLSRDPITPKQIKLLLKMTEIVISEFTKSEANKMITDWIDIQEKRGCFDQKTLEEFR